MRVGACFGQLQISREGIRKHHVTKNQEDSRDIPTGDMCVVVFLS